MDVFEAIRNRRSVRAFTGEAIPREDLETIVDAGRLAATLPRSDASARHVAAGGHGEAAGRAYRLA